MRKKALIVLANGFEEIEAIACIDVLRRVGVNVTVVGLNRLTVTAAHGLKVQADIRLKDYKKVPDAVIFPGGQPGATNLSHSRGVILLIKECFKKGKIVAAICASPAFALFCSGILKGKRVTCYPGCEKRLRDSIYVKRSVVVDGNIITSRGPATAMDFAFTIAERLAGGGLTTEVKKRMLVK